MVTGEAGCVMEPGDPPAQPQSPEGAISGMTGAPQPGDSVAAEPQVSQQSPPSIVPAIMGAVCIHGCGW